MTKKQWVMFWVTVLVILGADLSMIAAAVAGVWAAFVLYAGFVFAALFVLKIMIDNWV